MKAQEIAERYFGRAVRCRIIKSKPPLTATTITTDNGEKVYEGRIIGWKKGSISDPTEYVAIELINATSALRVDDLIATKGYVWTMKPLPMGKYAKKVYVDEVILPTGSIPTPHKSKDIPQWPNTCPACKSPAYVGGLQVDCSNQNCKHKYKTRDAISLFLPVELREHGWDKTPEELAKMEKEVSKKKVSKLGALLKAKKRP